MLLTSPSPVIDAAPEPAAPDRPQLVGVPARGVSERTQPVSRRHLVLVERDEAAPYSWGFARAREIIEAHGEDSLSPFMLRPDKAFHFAAGGVLAYQLIGGTAVVSSDPVAPEGEARSVLESFIHHTKKHRRRVVVWAASERHLADYRQLGLRSICAGEEAVVDPTQFTLEGRAVRKLRQSVHRAERHGWQIAQCAGSEITGELGREVAAFESAWRANQSRLHGFAMGFGTYDAAPRADDLYMLARSPEGRLGAVMHFIAHCGRLSLDTMHRVGDTPNGLNEALVSRALEGARRRDVVEVSLNYAGLGHLVRTHYDRGTFGRIATGALLNVASPRFQMEKLVDFNEKFSPQWRPRFLVYKSRAGLPNAIVRVLQAEGYLRQAGGETADPARSGVR